MSEVVCAKQLSENLLATRFFTRCHGTAKSGHFVDIFASGANFDTRTDIYRGGASGGNGYFNIVRRQSAG